MAIQANQKHLTRRRFNVEEYYRMSEVGILGWDNSVELLDGVIVMRDGNEAEKTRYEPDLHTYFRIFTADEYDVMIETGILSEDEQVELIRGEVVEMSPIGKRHAACVDRLTMLLAVQLVGKGLLRLQGPVRISEYSQLQPDVAVLEYRKDFYSKSLPTPGDVLLAIEVSDTSLAYDRQVKLALYAEAGISQVWLVNLPEEQVELYSGPVESGYRDKHRAGRADSLEIPGVEDVVLRVDDILD